MINHPNRNRRKTDRVFEEAVNPTRVEPAPAVERSFQGIRSALFDEWDNLRNGKTNADNAKAAARMADVILGSVETQLEALKFAKTNAEAPLLLK